MTKAEIQQVKLRFGIIGNNEALMRAIDIAIQVAPTDLSVLITGKWCGKGELSADNTPVQPAQAWTVHCRELWSHSRRDD